MTRLTQKFILAGAVCVLATAQAQGETRFQVYIPGLNGGSAPVFVTGSPVVTGTSSFSAAPGQSQTKNIVFTNTTTYPLRLNFEPSGQIAHPFTAAPQADCPAQYGFIAPGATCSVAVTFAPVAGDTVGSTFSDTTNLFFLWQYQACTVSTCTDPTPGGHSTSPVTVTGTVAAYSGTAKPQISGGPDLGTVAVGASVTRTLTLTNVGGNPLTLTSTPYTTGDASYGQVTVGSTTCGTTLAPGATCSISMVINAAPASWSLPAGTYTSAVGLTWQDSVAGLYSQSYTYAVQFEYP